MKPLLILMVLLLSSGPALAQDDMVRKLGDKDFKVRQQAYSALLERCRKMGKAAGPFLKQAIAKHKQLEVRSRLTAILSRLRHPRLLWHADVGSSILPISRPVVAGKLVLFSGTRRLACLDRDTGKQAWSWKGRLEAYQPLVRNGLVLIIARRELIALELTSGKKAWSLDLSAGKHRFHAMLRPALLGDRLLLGTMNGKLVCVGLKQRKVLWTCRPHARNELVYPIVWGQQIVVNCARLGLVCVSPETGKVLWIHANRGIIAIRPAVSPERLFLVDKAGKLTAIDADKRAQAWSAELGPGSVRSDIRVVGKRLLLGTYRKVQAWTTAGKRLWTCAWASSTAPQAFPADSTRVYLGCGPMLGALGLAKGEIAWTVDLGQLPEAAKAPKTTRGPWGSKVPPTIGNCGAPTLHRNRLYLATASGWALAFELPQLD